VAPGAFHPPPKVDSAVVRLTPRSVDPALAAGFLDFAGRCFRYKRKTLRNNLGHELPAASPFASRRAEQLSLDEFAALYRDCRARPL
jgi:16S rRNA (adenine1518-N6/adenine1519-N6)-dimethyltransferase